MKISRDLIVKNQAGFHLRVASMICKKVQNFDNNGLAFDGEVFLVNGPYRADCSSCLDLLALMAPVDTKIILEVEGDDEENVKIMADSITQMFETKFGEDEFAAR